MKEEKSNSCYHFIVLFIVGSMLTSCGLNSNSSKKVNESYKISARSVIDNNSKINHNLSELADGVQYVRLETNPSCFLRFINWLDITEDYILVSDSKGLYKFGKSGKFISEISRIGNGPGEHNGRIRIATDIVQNEVYIYSSGAGLVNIHDITDGSYKRSFTVDFDVNNFVIMPEGEIAFFTWETEFDINEVVFTDKDGEVVDRISNKLRSELRGNVSGHASVYLDSDNVYYMYNYRDTLYRVNNKLERSFLAVFDFDNKDSHNDFLIFPNPDVDTYFPDFISTPRILHNDSFIFATLQKGIVPGSADKQHLIRMLYDKSSNELTKTEGYTNNIDGGMRFWPRWIKEGVLIDYYHPYQMLDHYNETKNSIEHANAFLDIVQNLDENDNPVLVFITQQ